MDNDNSYLIATAEIDGEIIKLYRKGKMEGFYIPIEYKARDIEDLRSSIENNMYQIKHKFDKTGRFFSDDFGFCKLYIPEIICEVLEKDFESVNYGTIDGRDFIIFTFKDRIRAEELFNKHFYGNFK